MVKGNTGEEYERATALGRGTQRGAVCRSVGEKKGCLKIFEKRSKTGHVLQSKNGPDSSLPRGRGDERTPSWGRGMETGV